MARLRHRGVRPGVAHDEPYLSVWHEQRVTGQAERFDKVRECGSYQFALEHAGGAIPIQRRCDCWRVCNRCAKRRRYKLTEGMKRQRARALQVHRRESARYYRGKEGKWSEKLITFTVPHGDNPAEDARVLVDAWQQLIRKVRKHLMQRGAFRKTSSGKRAPVSVPWCRALEVSPGATGGHAHMHVWWHGPYLENALLRHWWGEIIERHGRKVPRRPWHVVRASGRDKRLASWLGNPRDDADILWPVVDITAARSSAASDYTQKVGVALYTVKGTDLQRLAPAHLASIYAVFEGTRAVQWARGWAPPKMSKFRGARLRRLTDDELAKLQSQFASSIEAAQKRHTGVWQECSAVAEMRAPP